jgi:hypothetical protein
VATPLEKILCQIDGVEYVIPCREGTSRSSCSLYVGEDASEAWSSFTRRWTETSNIVPPGVTGWVVKPVEIDDVRS